MLGRGTGMIPGAEYIEIEQTGHAPYWEAPEEFNEIAASFLVRHSDALS